MRNQQNPGAHRASLILDKQPVPEILCCLLATRSVFTVCTFELLGYSTRYNAAYMIVYTCILSQCPFHKNYNLLLSVIFSGINLFPDFGSCLMVQATAMGSFSMIGIGISLLTHDLYNHVVYPIR